MPCSNRPRRRDSGCPADTPSTDAELLHRWLTHPKSVFWLMRDAEPDDVRKAFQAVHDAPAHRAYLGLHDGEPAFLVEAYDPAHDPVGSVYPVRPGDVGMHFLVAPTDAPLHGFTLAVITTVMELLFADPANHRVVVEPDARNTPVHALNAAVGFQVERTVTLPDKDALLSFCTRAQYEATRATTAAPQE
ncbi:GNAT family N-acetyltransferase [Streptomyces hainanensis]|uniref:Lysine N-acyltransferase MbtK n=1 Tax=Streptomyces hainanensis TaxID=402648 RepID=A0A4R4SPL2_9ACTN|nr:GNAT family N-acetyltransferase [Streptomyces hainanensis]TDC64122.1 N-acetyltransferase [Streptomyces hainanensis]